MHAVRWYCNNVHPPTCRVHASPYPSTAAQSTGEQSGNDNTALTVFTISLYCCRLAEELVAGSAKSEEAAEALALRDSLQAEVGELRAKLASALELVGKWSGNVGRVCYRKTEGRQRRRKYCASTCSTTLRAPYHGVTRTRTGCPGNRHADAVAEPPPSPAVRAHLPCTSVSRPCLAPQASATSRWRSCWRTCRTLSACTRTRSSLCASSWRSSRTGEAAAAGPWADPQAPCTDTGPRPARRRRRRRGGRRLLRRQRPRCTAGARLRRAQGVGPWRTVGRVARGWASGARATARRLGLRAWARRGRMAVQQAGVWGRRWGAAGWGTVRHDDRVRQAWQGGLQMPAQIKWSGVRWGGMGWLVMDAPD